jgi:hypothetical protein
VFGNQNQVEGTCTCINVCDLSTREYPVFLACIVCKEIIISMTGVKFIITLASFITQFVPAELKMMVSYTVLKIILVYQADFSSSSFESKQR